MIKRATYFFSLLAVVVFVPFLIGKYLNFLGFDLFDDVFIIWVQGVLEAVLVSFTVYVVGAVTLYITDGTRRDQQ